MRVTGLILLVVLALAGIATHDIADAKSGKRINIISHERVLIPYQRPTATTRQQREVVQGGTCHTCGTTTGRMNADHRDPLVRQHHRGPVDVPAARDPTAVAPQCPTCSARQGGQLRAERQRLQQQARETDARVTRGCPMAIWLKNGGKC
jgi:hypothetical protein